MMLNCFTERKDCCVALAVKICDISKQALSRKSYFSLVLSGGSTPLHLYRLLASTQWRKKIEWQRAHIFFGDERCVPPTHAQSNYKMARDAMLKKLPIPEHHIHRIHGENHAETEAVRYQAVIEAYFRKLDTKEREFDLTLLGIGSDGHTASLFPGDPALQYSGLVAPVDIPKQMKPAVKRVTLTLSGLELSRNICFLAHGPAKQQIVLAILNNDTKKYPVAMVKSNVPLWFLSAMDCTKFAKKA